MSSFLYRRANASRRMIVGVGEKTYNAGSPELLDKYEPKQYEAPILRDMAIVIVFFNPNCSIRIIQNLLYIKALFDAANIPAFYGELAFNENPFVLSPASNIVQWRSSSYMFYKENLIVQLEAKIPAQYTKLCIIDADIIFEDKAWYDKVSKALNSYTIVQPFSVVYNLDISFRKKDEAISCLKKSNGHAGYVWAFQRSWFQRNPFFEYALIGGGDDFFGSKIKVANISYCNLYEDFKAQEPVEGHTKTFLDISICHLPHGIKANRQYGVRHAVMREQLRLFGLTYMHELTLRRDDGILIWKPEYIEVMNKIILQYFKTRDDDGV